MRKGKSKLVKLFIFLVITVMLASQAFETVAYARGSSGGSSHVSSGSRSVGSRSTPSSSAKSGSFSSSPKSSSSLGGSSTKSSNSSKTTPSSSAKSGSFSASPKSSSSVGSSKSSTSNNNNSTVIVNNHTYVSHSSNVFFFVHRTYYVDDYGMTHYMPYRPNYGGIIFSILLIILVVYVIVRISKNNRR